MSGPKSNRAPVRVNRRIARLDWFGVASNLFTMRLNPAYLEPPFTSKDGQSRFQRTLNFDPRRRKAPGPKNADEDSIEYANKLRMTDDARGC